MFPDIANHRIRQLVHGSMVIPTRVGRTFLSAMGQPLAQHFCLALPGKHSEVTLTAPVARYAQSNASDTNVRPTLSVLTPASGSLPHGKALRPASDTCPRFVVPLQSDAPVQVQLASEMTPG